MKLNPVTGYKIGTRVARVLPPWLAYPLCHLAGMLLYRFNRSGRAAVKSNMRHVVGPAASKGLVSRLARNVFINNLKNYYDMLRLPYLDHTTVRSMVKVKDAHYALDELAKGKGIILISAHLGNFNLIIQAADALGVHLTLLAEPIEPPELYEYITALRESQGLKLIPVGGPALRQVFRILKDGQALGIATDRDVTNSGEMLPFFGQPTSMPVGAVEIARRSGAPIVPVLIYRQSNNRSVAQLYPPLALAHTDDPAADSAANKRLLIATLERFIAAHPDQWIILQRMWDETRLDPGARSLHPSYPQCYNPHYKTLLLRWGNQPSNLAAVGKCGAGQAGPVPIANLRHNVCDETFMYCSHLDLTDFRLYERLKLDLPPHLSVFVGDNASGKTSLLEAIYFLATTKSQRSNSDAELINSAAVSDLGTPPFVRLVAEVERRRGELNVEIVIARDEAREVSTLSSGLARKRIRLNKVARRAVDLIGQVNVVMFSPEDMTLITSPPSNRRRYLDITISQIDHRYMMHLSQYNKVLLQRNALLRQIRERQRNPLNPAVKEEMRYWDEELTKAGAYIVLRRQDFLVRLTTIADPIHAQLMGGGPRLHLDYQSQVASNARTAMLPELKQPRSPATPELPAMIPHATRLSNAVQEEFARQLASANIDEARRGVSLLGPHRDDFSFTLGNDKEAVDLGTYGSRGQQRTAILAMKLAEVALMEQETGDTPILLLDDILSELDASRRQFLLDTVQARPQQQALITATDLDHFTPSFLANATQFRVVRGEVSMIDAE